MKLRSLLHRRPADQVPLLPAIEPENGRRASGASASLRSVRAAAQEERLERLLTPSELDLVLRRRL
ncbi:hypothetical protein IU486_04100 [Streptomyces gardneri]|uniref:hypothetical protein n=1 Tax=Nocardia TaxID=1817 RepID=UPI00135ABBFE|nr:MULTISPECIES: hypothetical protein [Nocardia]MBF6163956.1 hypothetical protein [Streptomyces gardneri]MBF6203532.1 hypothetical protein [Streptomyces gardneri]UAK33593.1 hypothetical protein K8O92_06525 [Nocardia asteroides]